MALGQRLAAAGWQPVTGALLDKSQVLVARYGSGQETYLVFYNTSIESASTAISIDRSAPEFPAIVRVTEALSVDGAAASLQSALLHGGVATLAPPQLSALRLS